MFELISQIWPGTSSSPESLETKISRCQSEIIKWSKEQNQNNAQRIRETQMALEAALSSSFPNPAEIGQLTATLDQAYKEEGMFWKQRSRVLWLQSGNRNT